MECADLAALWMHRGIRIHSGVKPPHSIGGRNGSIPERAAPARQTLDAAIRFSNPFPMPETASSEPPAVPPPAKDPSASGPMISLRGLTKRFGIQTAVNSLSLEIPAGQIVGLLGPNGAGKTTTLRMLSGLLEPSAGSATIAGHDLSGDPLELKRDIGFVPDSGAVFESLTGLEFLEMIAALYGIDPKTARHRIGQFMQFFDLGIDDLSMKLLGAYSKGMRRKIVITAALLHNPPVVFFDEPLDGLDANAALGLKTLIQHLAREGKTIIYSSHILDVVEKVCDRVVIIDEGTLKADGAPGELVRAHRADSLEQLFTGLTAKSDVARKAEDFARTFHHEP